MRQLQESIRPKEGIPAGLRSNWDLRWLAQGYQGSDCDKLENTSECQRELWVDLWTAGSAGDRPGSADDQAGSISNRCQAVWENNIFFGNTACAPGNHSYYLSFNEIQTSCIQFVFSSIYLCSYPSTDCISVLAAGGAWVEFKERLKMMIGWTQGYTPRLRSSESGYAHVGRDQVNLVMHSEIVNERVCRYTWRCYSSVVGDTFGGHDQMNLDMHSKIVIERGWRCTWRPW